MKRAIERNDFIFILIFFSRLRVINFFYSTVTFKSIVLTSIFPTHGCELVEKLEPPLGPSVGLILSVLLVKLCIDNLLMISSDQISTKWGVTECLELLALDC